MSIKRLSGNALASSISTVFNAAFLFIYYRFLVVELGIEQIGVWSLLLATCALARLGELGMAGGVSKFVGNDLGANKPLRAITTISMAGCFLIVVVGTCAVLLVPGIKWALGHFVSHNELRDVALSMVPWTLASVWMAALVNLLCASLDGNQRTVLRCVAMMLGGIAQLLLAYRWIPEYGLQVLGKLQFTFLLIQGTLLLIMLVCVMRQPASAWMSWDLSRFKQMLRYGASLQVTSVGQMLFEPTVRWLLGIFSGLTVTGYYDLASRAVVQFRLAITAAFQMIVPYYATHIGRLGEGKPAIQSAYRRTSRLLLLISVPYFTLIGCILPFLLTWWAGEYHEEFILIGFICLSGWFVNTLAVPAFMLYLALGKLRWIAVTQLVIGLLNLALGLLLGYAFGGIGVISAAMLALSFGSYIVYNRFQKEYDVKFQDFVPPSIKFTAAIGVLATIFFSVQATIWRGSGIPSYWVSAIFCAVALSLAMSVWSDPLRKELMKKLISR